MSARLNGIGLLSLGCVAAAAGGYLAIKQDPPVPTAVQSAPAPVPAPAAQVVQTPTVDPAAEPETSRVESRPAPKTQIRTLVSGTGQPVNTSAPTARADSETPQPVSAPRQPPVTPEPSATPVVDPTVTATPTPAVAEPPRYVPESVQTSATTQDPPRLEFEEVTVAKHSVIGIRLDSAISTRTARVEDRVSATVSRDVTVDGRTAIAAGVRLEGTVVLVERGGRFRNRPRLGLEFDRMILADGTRVNIKTDTIYREGDSPSADATAKVGAGAAAGAILGAVLGGKKGAAIGGIAGAAGGAATVMRGDQGETSLAAGAPLTVRLTEQVTVAISR